MARPLKYGSRNYEKLANALARSIVFIRQCKKCSYPHVDGYCCHYCRDRNPTMTFEQEKAWEQKYG